MSVARRVYRGAKRATTSYRKFCVYHTSPTHVAHALSPWKPFSQRYVAIWAETSSAEKHLASRASLLEAASILDRVQASASDAGGGDGGGVINALSDGGRGGSADASSIGQGGLLLIRERATANNSAVRLARFFRAAQRTGTPKNSCSFGISSSGAIDTAWAVISAPAPLLRTACAVIARLLRPLHYPIVASADPWTVSNQQCIAFDNSSISNVCGRVDGCELAKRARCSCNVLAIVTH